MLYPSYLNLYETGELAERAAAAWEVLRSCTICKIVVVTVSLAKLVSVILVQRLLSPPGTFTAVRSLPSAGAGVRAPFSLVTARHAAPTVKTFH